MKSRQQVFFSIRAEFFLAVLLFAAGSSVVIRAQDKLQLQILPRPGGLEVRMPSAPEPPVAGAQYENLKLERSQDLVHWESAGDLQIGNGVEGVKSLLLDGKEASAFFRVQGDINFSAGATDGSEVFGYNWTFRRELKRLGQISVEDFARLYPPPQDYLPQIDFDPTAAAFWTDFSADPTQYNASLPAGTKDIRLTDFRLNAQELALFKTNGFVVSERLGSFSFADSFYKIYTDDLPVFVSADAILHAWHRSYLAMLDELEELFLSNLLKGMLDKMAARVPETYAAYGGGVLQQSILDADYYLAVGRSLLTGSNVLGSLNQESRVTNTLAAIKKEQLIEFQIFGASNLVDFSQFKVRGHYDESENLRRYFKAMMWFGRIDLRIAEDPRRLDVRELGTAITLQNLLQSSGQLPVWQRFDQVIQNFVGWTDSMTPPQLGDLLTAAGITSPADIASVAVLTNLQAKILEGQLGSQQIRSDAFPSPLGPEQIKLPRSWTFLGQRFVPDSWVFSQTVFDSVIWDKDGILSFDDKVDRRLPSALEIAFAALGNSQVVPELVSRITSTNGVPFRDGLPYQHNLAAARLTLDSQSADAWESNIYMSWLRALRELSIPTTAPKYPQVMRTRAWAMRSLNTQLASWTELRHDTILYAKQSYSGFILCFYPDGFVEPVRDFWVAMEKMALLTAKLFAGIPRDDLMRVPLPIMDRGPDASWRPTIGTTTAAQLLDNQIQHLNRFQSAMYYMRAISERELAQQPLADNETAFLRGLVEAQDRFYVGGRTYSGWYPQLFYMTPWDGISYQNGGTHPAAKADQIVTDVHTAPPDSFGPYKGAVLHEGIGTVHMLMLAVDNGPDRMVYAGPVLSHYEFQVGTSLTNSGLPALTGASRLSDPEWQGIVYGGKTPPPPDWTKSYLVPAKP